MPVPEWIRRSMGLRGTDPVEGFFLRMRERANGSRRGLLEALIELSRGRSYTRAQCAAITQVHDETEKRLVKAESDEERRSLVEELDRRIKQIVQGLKDPPSA